MTSNIPEELEMTATEIKEKFGALIQEAVQAFALDANYAADITKKAKLIEVRRAKRKN